MRPLHTPLITHHKQFRQRSSVVEHPIRNRAVVSSILTAGSQTTKETNGVRASGAAPFFFAVAPTSSSGHDYVEERIPDPPFVSDPVPHKPAAMSRPNERLLRPRVRTCAPYSSASHC